MVIYQTIRK